eukprot:TRINITY_DN14743_c0_g1_i3.p1 TRINITY_DN14743_c0_g1~~TRINITY_DN14743_c0_g1_i3.p1  ORF type:complete len:148 (-),score=24.95 TRINITY_DN14743_c0_g1_i3:119-541(-)
MYMTSFAGYFCTLIIFGCIAYKASKLLEDIYTEEFKNSLRRHLIIFVGLLSMRLILALFNLTNYVLRLREMKLLFIYVVVFMLMFEVAPTMVLLKLSSLTDTSKGSVSNSSLGEMMKRSEAEKLERVTPEDMDSSFLLKY